MKRRPGPGEIPGSRPVSFAVLSSQFSVRPVDTLKPGTHNWELVCLFCVHKNDGPVTTPFSLLATLPQYARASEVTMSRIGLGLLLGITLMGAGCGYSSHNYMNGNGMPKITQLMPNATAHGGAAFPLTIQGSGFGKDSLVYLGTITRTTAYATTSQVTADITAADIMNARTLPVYGHSSGPKLDPMPFP